MIQLRAIDIYTAVQNMRGVSKDARHMVLLTVNETHSPW